MSEEQRRDSNKWKILKNITTETRRNQSSTKMKLISFLFRRNSKIQAFNNVHVPLTRSQILEKFHRAFIILKTIYKLNKICEQIVIYGTSQNLFDLSSRDRPALKRYLYPILYQEINDNATDQTKIEFPLIVPNSIIKSIWNPIIFVIMIYTATLLPYRMSFEMDDNNEGWIIFDWIISACYWIDMIIEALSTTEDEDGNLMRTRKDVFLNYIRTWFIVDLLACLPMDQITESLVGTQANNKNFQLVKLARLPRIQRLFRLTRVFKFIRFYYKEDLSLFLDFNAGIVKMINMFITFAVMVHLMACIWAYTALLESDQQDTWMTKFGVDQLMPWSKYIASVYFTLTVVTTVGYGDITAITTTEMIIVIFYMIVGVGFYSYAVGYLTSVLSNMDRKPNTLQSKIATLNEFCKEMKISKQLKQKLKKTLEYNSEKQCFTWMDCNELFEDLPIQLKNQIIFSIHDQAMADLQLFRITENKAFAIRIIPLMKPIIRERGEYLWVKGSTPDGIYCLITGRVVYLEEFLLVDKQTKKLVGFKSMINGSFFGEIEIFQQCKREYFVQCEEICEFYFLDTEQFLEIVPSEFPLINKRLRAISHERMVRNKKALQELKNIITQINKSKNNNKTKSTDLSPKRRGTQILHIPNFDTAIQLSDQDTKESPSHLKSTPKNTLLESQLKNQNQQIQEIENKIEKIDNLILQLENCQY